MIGLGQTLPSNTVQGHTGRHAVDAFCAALLLEGSSTIELHNLGFTRMLSLIMQSMPALQIC
jgi:hypothetical protein